MNVQGSSKKLIHEVLAVVIRQVLPGVDDSVHVSLHEVCDNVNIFETFGGRRLLDVDEPDNVFMVKELYTAGSNLKLNTYSIV